jgi:lipoprotein-anchoring transpeptidase ErfK/SrfK
MSRPNSRLVMALCAVALLGTACSSGEGAGPPAANSPGDSPSAGSSQTPGGGEQSAPNDSPAVAVTPADDAEKVRPDQPVIVKVTSGTITELEVEGPDGDDLKGSYSADRSQWTGLPQLRPGARYTVSGTTRGTDGTTTAISSSFRTLTADSRLKASVSPLGGTTVGVAMPIQVFWNHPVKDRAAVERRLSITTSVPVEGTWHWNDDRQVNFRPKVYWPAHTKVTVNIDTRGVKAGDGLWGWANRKIEFQIGTSVVSRVDVVHHVMTVAIDGKVARRIPITAGKDGFTTRSGNKVIMEKFRVKRMDARTVGIKPGDPEYYDIHDVQYAHRVTSSGEFVHGAPWSSGSQGRENVSHGCVGMSLANGAWFFSQTHIGDPIIVTGTARRIEPGNGWTDWNVSWDTYKRGSALN